MFTQQIKKRKGFDDNWRDDVLDEKSLDIPLTFPLETEPNNKMWIDYSIIKDEVILKEHHTYETYRKVTAMLKPSDKINHYSVTNANGESVDLNSRALNFMFPPKAWMSDHGTERTTMYMAAKEATGNVLVGGLGLAIYPQFILYLNNNIKSITIIDNDPSVIELVGKTWLEEYPGFINKVEIIESSIEDYLANTEKKFDTIYLDTWEDVDPRFLSSVNHLIDLSGKVCCDDGKIHCWGYALMVDTFIELVCALSERDFDWDEYNFDPALERFSGWLKKQDKKQNAEEIKKVAKFFALDTTVPAFEYERERCYTFHGVSHSDRLYNLSMARK